MRSKGFPSVLVSELVSKIRSATLVLLNIGSWLMAYLEGNT